MSTLCHAFGLPVATELEIPGAIPAELPWDGQTAFRVELGNSGSGEGLGKGLGLARTQDGPYRVVPEGLLFEKQDVARFLCCRGGERLVVDPAPGARESDIATYLIATAIPALLWMRGEIVLHGAVAVLPGAERAIVALGASGSGKSCLLQEIVEAGGKVAAEDSFRVWTEEGRVMAAGLPGLIHTRTAGAPLAAERGVRPVPTAQQLRSAELSAMVLLLTMPPEEEGAQTRLEGLTGGSSHGLVTLHGVDALEAVLCSRHRPRVPDLLGLSAGVLRRCGALAGELPVYSWEFLQAAFRSPGKGGIWHSLERLPRGRVGRE